MANNQQLATEVVENIVKFLLEKNKNIPIDTNLYVYTDSPDTASAFELLSNEERICVRAKNREEANIILHLVRGIVDGDDNVYILECGLVKSKLENKDMITLGEIIQMISKNQNKKTVIIDEDPEEGVWKRVMKLQDKNYSSAGSSIAIVTLESLAKYMKLI